jgi:hypothetical protein
MWFALGWSLDSFSFIKVTNVYSGVQCIEHGLTNCIFFSYIHRVQQYSVTMPIVVVSFISSALASLQVCLPINSLLPVEIGLHTVTQNNNKCIEQKERMHIGLIL